ncbi:putative metal homeostasis protein [Marinilactibacillus psychrotolerans]
MPEKTDLATTRRMMKSPNKKTARRGLKIIKETKRLKRGLKK